MTHEVGLGTIVWVALMPVKGREQGGHRPAVVISSFDYLSVVTDVVIVLPSTTVDRGWPNHVLITGPTGLQEPTYAMTEQPRTISRDRITGVAGQVDAETLARLEMWVRDWTFASQDPGWE